MENMENMENKYYTPEMDEFCVGFEYEYLSSSSRMGMLDMHSNKLEYLSPTLEIWKKSIFDGKNEYSFGASFDFEIHLENNNIRVKLLAGEGIEGEGWIWDDKKEHGESYFKFVKYRSDKHRCNLRVIHHNLYSWLVFEIDHDVIFAGKIKNLTEFKKLLKQLGI